MELNIPRWATDEYDDNTIVLLWFLRKIAQKWPLTSLDRYHNKHFSFCINKEDVETILQTKYPVQKLYRYSSIKQALTVIDTGDGYTFQFKSAFKAHMVEISSQRAEEIVIYLLGCLNHNLMEDSKEYNYTLTDKIIRRRWPLFER